MKILAIRFARLGDVILLIPALRSLKAAFPDGKVRSPGQPSPDMKNNYNRSIYVTDPDGVDLQLVTSADDGWLNPSAGGGGN